MALHVPILCGESSLTPLDCASDRRRRPSREARSADGRIVRRRGAIGNLACGEVLLGRTLILLQGWVWYALVLLILPSHDPAQPARPGAPRGVDARHWALRLQHVYVPRGWTQRGRVRRARALGVGLSFCKSFCVDFAAIAAFANLDDLCSLGYWSCFRSKVWATSMMGPRKLAGQIGRALV